jgi:hypothetical protein
LKQLLIIPVQQWLCSRSLYQVIRAEILVLAKQCSIEIEDDLFNKNYLPKTESYAHIHTDLLHLRKTKKGKDLEIIQRVILGLEMMDNIIDSECTSFEVNQMRDLLGVKKYDDLKEKVVKNSFTNDLHFLPNDDQNIDWSAISRHSVVLFRYPITVPIEIFDLASDIDCSNWELSIDELSQRFPTATSFKKVRPLKSLRLKQEFLSDLLTRYIGLYIRIGSPDFTDDIINKFREEI